MSVFLDAYDFDYSIYEAEQIEAAEADRERELIEAECPTCPDCGSIELYPRYGASIGDAPKHAAPSLFCNDCGSEWYV